jgi:hypothetical protein
MANEETFRPRRPNRQQEEQAPPFEKIEQMPAAANAERDEDESLPPMNPAGNSPQWPSTCRSRLAEWRTPQKLSNRQCGPHEGKIKNPSGVSVLKKKTKAHEHPLRNFDNRAIASSGQLKELLEGLKGSPVCTSQLNRLQRAGLYDGENGPSDGVLYVRPMTGEEEQILATPRFVPEGSGHYHDLLQMYPRENYRPEQLSDI